MVAADKIYRDEPICCGYLVKQGGSGFLKNWRRRWFILKDDHCLYYYKTDKVIIICLTIKKLRQKNFKMCEHFCFKKIDKFKQIFCQEADPLGAILLTNYTITKAPEVNRKHTFKAVKYGQRTYMFQAESEADMNRWANAMSCAATANTKVMSREYSKPSIVRSLFINDYILSTCAFLLISWSHTAMQLRLLVFTGLRKKTF